MNKANEPLLLENNERFVLFPIQHRSIWDMYKRAESNFWTAEEIDLSSDIHDWDEKLNRDEKNFVKYILAYFATSNGIVNKNIAVNCMREVQLPEARCFYGFQTMTENIHSETYSMIIDAYIKDQKEREYLFQAMDHIPFVSRKATWALNWISNGSFAERLIAFAAVEEIFVAGSIAAIFGLRNKGLMPGLSFANELISRDEKLHSQFACLLYSQLKNPLSKEQVTDIISNAVNIEQKFIKESMSAQFVGMNAAMICQYVEYVADKLLGILGYPKHYEVTNPLDFMELSSLKDKTNFFENRAVEFQKSAVSNEQEEDILSDEDEF